MKIKRIISLKSRKTGSTKGFLLIEALLAVTILACGLILIIQTQVMGLSMLRRQQVMAKSLLNAEDIVGEKYGSQSP